MRASRRVVAIWPPPMLAPHRRREVHDARHPIHVTMRCLPGLPSLRSRRLCPVVRRGLAAGSRADFRICHFTVQGNHVHLLIEAGGKCALGRGMQGLGIRLAKAINRELGRAGRVWSDRYHCHALKTPRETRNGLIYVLFNGRKHGVSGRGIDACSSGAWFRGWHSRPEPSRGPAPVVPPRTWLLAVGWRRSGPISFDDAPAGRRVKTLPARDAPTR